MHYIAENLKFIRKEKGWTQGQLAHQLGVKRSLIGAYEEGRADPRISFLMLIGQKFGITLDDLVSRPLEPGFDQRQELIAGNALRILPITVDREQNTERVTLVPVKAAAGYLNGFGDVEFIESLPTFDLPFPEVSSGKTYRVFQIKGDSMQPIPSNAYILGSYVLNWNHIRNDELYVVVSRSEGIVFKRVLNNLSEGHLVLKSDNPEYEAYRVDVEDIAEVWKAEAVTTFDIDRPVQGTTQEMAEEIRAIRERLDALTTNK